MRTVIWTKPVTETQTPTMHRAILRNVPASVVEAVDSREEQAEVGKQNKPMRKRSEPVSKY